MIQKDSPKQQKQKRKKNGKKNDAAASRRCGHRTDLPHRFTFWMENSISASDILPIRRKGLYSADDDIYSAAVCAIYAVNTEEETVGREGW